MATNVQRQCILAFFDKFEIGIGLNYHRAHKIVDQSDDLLDWRAASERAAVLKPDIKAHRMSVTLEVPVSSAVLHSSAGQAGPMTHLVSCYHTTLINDEKSHPRVLLLLRSPCWSVLSGESRRGGFMLWILSGY